MSKYNPKTIDDALKIIETLKITTGVERNIIWKRIKEYYFNGNLKDIISFLQMDYDYLSTEFKFLRVESVYEDEYVSNCLLGGRDENDKEYLKRLKNLILQNVDTLKKESKEIKILEERLLELKRKHKVE